MTYFSPETGKLQAADLRPPEEDYDKAHKNFVIGYTDVAPRDPETGKFFFPVREIEPRKGIWFIGGRMSVGDSVQQSAARHLARDTGLEIPEGRFREISHFGIADTRPAKDGEGVHSRHAANTVLTVNLTPAEVAELNRGAAEGGFSSEISNGEWYDPTTKNPDLSGPIKQFLRDYYTHEVTMSALHTEAMEEDHLRSSGTL